MTAATDATATVEAICSHWKIRLNDLPLRRMPIEIPNATRADLATFLAQQGFSVGAEIGVQHGEYSEMLCKANPALRLKGIDPYSVRADYDDGRHTQADFDAFRTDAVARLRPYGVDLIRETSMSALETVLDVSLDFVYVDGHHNFQNVTNDLCEWTRKVRIGGIIAGDDYYKTKSHADGLHVQHVVDAFTDAYGIRPWFVLGRKVSAPGETRDRHRSFFWVRDASPLDRGH